MSSVLLVLTFLLAFACWPYLWVISSRSMRRNGRSAWTAHLAAAGYGAFGSLILIMLDALLFAPPSSGDKVASIVLVCFCVSFLALSYWIFGHPRSSRTASPPVQETLNQWALRQAKQNAAQREAWSNARATEVTKGRQPTTAQLNGGHASVEMADHFDAADFYEVEFTYQNSDDEISNRVVNVREFSVTHFVGFCSLRRALRTFRYDGVIGTVVSCKTGEQVPVEYWRGFMRAAQPGKSKIKIKRLPGASPRS